MIRVFIGEDTQNARKALRKAVDASLATSGATTAQRFSDVGFNPQSAREAIFAQNLFGGKNTVVFDGLLDAKDSAEFYFVDMATAPNSIFIRETAPNKSILEILQKIGTIKEFKKFKRAPETNFPLVDAISARDKKTAWALYVKAKERGAVAEELHGIIFWGVKMLYLCANYSKEEAIKAGVNQSNYSKYLTNSKKYLGAELSDRLRVLRNMYHNAHRGDGDFDTMLEQYILKV